MNGDIAFTRTRLAPTPSGYLHMGNLLSFVLTTGLARRFGAKVLLRIDDMDRDRVRDEYVQDIFDTLNFMEINWDEGPRDAREFNAHFTQLLRMDQYGSVLSGLAAAKQVFGCNCSRSLLSTQIATLGYPGTCLHSGWSLDEKNIQWRLITEKAAQVSIRELQAGVQKYALSFSMQYAQVRRRDGKPAYQLCSLVDDLFFGVDLIVRGRDLFDSSLLQLYLSQLLPDNSFGATVFFHHPLLLQDGLKMSKSEGASSIFHLRKQGIKRAEVYRRLALHAGLEPTATDAESLFELLQDYAGLS
jgi:glutamyl-tRNA synthetase